MSVKNIGFSALFLIGLFAFATVSLSIVSAQEKVGGVEIKDVKISTKNDNIEITAVLFNPSQNIETSPFTHLLTLSSINELFKFGESIATPPPILVSAVEGSDYVSLKPQEQRTVNFFLPISPFLPKNNYTLNMAMILTNGEVLDSYRDVVYDLGFNQKVGDFYKGGFLTFDQWSCVVITPDGEKFGNNDGPIVKSLEAPKIRCAIKNISQEELTVFSNIEWKELFVYSRPSSGKKEIKKSSETFVFKPGELKTIELSLPAAERPQVYQALLSFIDKDNIVRSYNMDFRWTIGGSSARVEKVALASPVKSVYEAGENISLSVDYFGSMDLFWGGISQEKVSALSEVKTLAIVKNKNGAVCGQAETTLPDIGDAGIHNKIIDIKLDRQCAGMSYGVSLFSRGENLANASDIFPVVIEEGAEEEKTKTSFIYYIIAALILIFAYKIFTIMNRRKHRDDWQKNLVVFLFIAGITGFFFGGFNTAEAVKTLTVQNKSDDGIGTGVIKEPSDATNINCSTGGTNGIGDCDGNYANNAIITLTAILDPGSIVSTWVGGGPNCPLPADINKCQTRMSVNKTIKARFARAYTLTIEPGPGPAPGVTDDGSGKVIEDSSKINCDISGGAVGGICNDDYVSGSDVYISGPLGGVEPDGTSIFTGWMGGGGCIDGTDCDLTMTGNKTVKAVFRLISNLFKSFTPKLKERTGTNNSFTGSTDSLFAAVSKGFVSEWRSFNITSAIVTFDGSVSNNKVKINFYLDPRGCGNTAYVFGRVKMTVGADGSAEQPVNFRKDGSTDPYPSKDSNFDITNSAERERLYNIDPIYLIPLESKTNPRLNIYITAATRPFGVLTYSRRGFFDFSYTDAYNFNIDLNQFGVVGTTFPYIFPADEAYDASDVIKIKIPLVFPPPNNPPVLDSIGNKPVDENQLLSITVSAIDLDVGDTLTYSASSLPVPSPLPSGAAFTGKTFSWTPTFSQSGSYPVRFTVSDGKGGADYEDITITVNNVNQPPIISAVGSPHTLDITPPTSHTHTGAIASDPDGDPLTYSWTWDVTSPCQPSCPVITGGSTLTPSYTPTTAGDYKLQLSVFDGATAVTAPLTETTNIAPVAAVGSPHTLTVGTEHSHSGASVTDPDGAGSNLAKYKWDWVSCPPPSCPSLSTPADGAEVFIDGISALAGAPTYTPASAGDYTLKLTVTDDMGATGEATIIETATSLPPPSSSAPSNWWDLFNNMWREKQ